MKIKEIFSDWLIGIVLTVLLLAGFLLEWYPLQSLEYKTYDFRMKFRQRKVSAPVAIVAIDDESIQKLGRWPWPRAYMADMIRQLTEYGAKVIGINVLYSEPDKNSGLSELRALREDVEKMPNYQRNAQLSTVYDAISKAEQRLDNDAILAEAISSAKNVVLPLSFALSEQQGGADPNIPEFLKKNSRALASAAFMQAAEVAPPINEFTSGAMGLGHMNILPDEDGTLRREPIFIQYKGRIFPSLGVQAALKYLNYGVETVDASNGIRMGNIRIPVDRREKMLISYCGKFNTFTYYSFVDVMDNEAPGENFKNKIVLIGHTATGIASLGVTPLQSSFPSIEITANVIENILNNNFMSRPGWALYLEIALIALFGLYISFLIPKLRAGISAVITAGLLAAWNGAAVFFFISKGWWLMMFTPSLLLFLGYTVIMSKRYMVTERKKELVEADSIETNKMLGLSFQGQGMLDIAFEKFRKCPIEDEAVKDLLYNLGLDFERKRMLNKAAAVYEHILKAGEYKDIKERIEKLKTAGETMIFGAAVSGRKDATIIVEGSSTTPTLGRYEVQKELGKGAMGTVFLGKDPKINRMVAIKTIRFDEIEESMLDETKKRFFREAEAAGTLSHPNIVTIFDAGEDYGVAYVAMELLDGADLAAYTSKEKKLPVTEVLRIAKAVADGLDYAHAKGVVHRDIKPANIMLLSNGEVKITDFGIARVMATSSTQTGVVLGTPSYMSPEQVVGKKVDGRSDLFSLGVVLYELLSCEKPFKGDSLAALMYNIANKPPAIITKLDPAIPECCAYITHKLLLKSLEKRYQSGKEVVRDINLCLRKIGAA